MVPPNFRQVSPGGHGVALQSWAEVSEQRMRSLVAGCTGFKAFRISIAVTCTRVRATRVRSPCHAAMIVLPTLLGRTAPAGVVMATTVWRAGAGGTSKGVVRR